MSDSEDEEPMGLEEPQVVTKYQTAGNVANAVLKTVVEACCAGKPILELCQLGDEEIEKGVAGIYNKPRKDKGVAFPTCVSVNHCAGHYSPLSTDTTAVLENGDVVKIDLGVHIDGYVAVVGHTTVVTETPDVAVPGRQADVICAAHFAAEAVLRMLKPGVTNTQMTDMIAAIAAVYGCSPIEGVLSHEMKQYVIGGNNVIMNKTTTEQKVDEFVFEENQVFGVDIIMSTGEGKPLEKDTRTTVYQGSVDQSYHLKMKASRKFYSEMNARFQTFPFSLRALSDERSGKLGVTECLSHDLISSYPVLYEKPGEYVAQFKFTALIMPSNTIRVTEGPGLPFVTSEFKIEDQATLDLLATSTKRKSKKKKKKKKDKQPAPEEEEGAGAAAE